MVAVDGLGLLLVEAGRVRVDVGDVEGSDELVAREHIAVGGDRPAEEREVVQQTLVDEALLAQKEQIRLRIALGELLGAGLPQHEWHVTESRHEVGHARVIEGRIQCELTRRRRHEVLAADDVGDAHQRVVHRVREGVESLPARAHDDEVGERSGGEGHLAADEVDIGDVVVGHAQPVGGLASLRAEGRSLLVAEIAVEIVVAELLGATGGLVARVDLVRGRIRLVDRARGDELLQYPGVDLAALRLTVRGVRAALLDALVPVDLEPGERVDELAVALLAVARGVSVFDAEDQLAPRVARIRPVVEGGADHADVRKTRRRRAEPNADVGSGGGGGTGIDRGRHPPQSRRHRCARPRREARRAAPSARRRATAPVPTPAP